MSLSQGTVTDITIPGPGPFGFRLAGGKDFGLPLHISKTTAGGKAQRANLREKDVILMINGQDVATYTHMEAQNIIKASYHGDLHLRTQRGHTRVWNPVTRDTSGNYRVSLKANNDQEFLHPGSKTNFTAKGFGSPKAPPPASVPPPGGRGSAQVVHLQFNSPAGLYSEQNIAETFRGQTAGMIDNSVGIDDYQPQPYQPLRDMGYSSRPGEVRRSSEAPKSSVVSATMIERNDGEETNYSGFGFTNPGAQSRSFRMLKEMMDYEDRNQVAKETMSDEGGAGTIHGDLRGRTGEREGRQWGGAPMQGRGKSYTGY